MRSYPARPKTAISFSVFIVVVASLVLIPAVTAGATPGPAMTLVQFGTTSDDFATAIAADASAIYLTGGTGGTMVAPSAGGRDVFVQKRTTTGTVVWSKQFGSSANDRGQGIAVDGAGGVYVAGYTFGSLPGNASSGGMDAFVRKYDKDGNVLWTHQWGTANEDAATSITVQAVTVDSSTDYVVYVVGDTGASASNNQLRDAYIRKYDSSGSEIWTRVFGTDWYDYSHGVATDSGGNAYVAGYTYGDLAATNAGSNDVFLRKYNAEGTAQWTRQFGTASIDNGYSVASDGSRIYLAGYTGGALEGASAGSNDAFVRAYDGSGTVLWGRQFGTSAADEARAVAAAGGKVYVAGWTGGGLEGASNGASDAFLREYADDGTESWTDQVGTTATDEVMGVAAGAGKAYVAGYTYGALPANTHAGGFDPFVGWVTVGPSNTAPADPSGLGQFESDGTTAIAVGGQTTETTVVLKGTISDADSDTVKLQVEVKPAASAFDGTTDLFAGSLVASGSTQAVEVTGLTVGAYHWRARAIDEHGLEGDWVAYGGNDASATDFEVYVANVEPADPSTLGQFESDGTTAIAVGGQTTESTVVLEGTISDPDSDTVKLQVEVKPAASAFDGTTDLFAGSLVASGSTQAVEVTGLTVGAYHWRARAIDEHGLEGDWVAYGGNEASATDFEVYATTTLQYSGDQIVYKGGTLTAAAKLSSGDSSCIDERTISFEILEASSYTVPSDTTNASGQATSSGVNTGAWGSGVYTIQASFAGAAGCGASSDTATLTIADPGDSAVGGGWYLLNGRVNFAFTVHQVKGTDPPEYKGQILVINSGKWRFKGTISRYVTLGSSGAVGGSGTLYRWDQSLNEGLGDWVLVAVNVTYSALFADNGSGKNATPDTFGIDINYVPGSGTLPNSGPEDIKGGNVRIGAVETTTVAGSGRGKKR